MSNATLQNLEKIKDYYGVSEDVLKTQSADILEKMLDAAADDNIHELHSLGYYIFAPKFAANSIS